MEIRDMESKDYPEIDRLMKELHELHVKGRPDLYTELEHPSSREEKCGNRSLYRNSTEEKRYGGDEDHVYRGPDCRQKFSGKRDCLTALRRNGRERQKCRGKKAGPYGLGI